MQEYTISNNINFIYEYIYIYIYNIMLARSALEKIINYHLKAPTTKKDLLKELSKIVDPESKNIEKKVNLNRPKKIKLENIDLKGHVDRF